MAATGKTPILLYGSTTPTNVPVAGNLTNSSDGCEIAINVADKNLFFKDATNAVNTVPIRQASASSNGWLSSTNWSTFNSKASTTSPTFSGNVTLSNGNLVIGTSGKGIDFSVTSEATGMTSELLADYEEGTFTPVVYGTTSAGTGTYTSQSGIYTKVGRLVTYQIQLSWTAHTGAGDMNISGLPYTSGAGTASVASVGSYQMAMSANNTAMPYVGASATTVTLLQMPAGGGAWATIPLDTSVGALWISGSYTV